MDIRPAVFAGSWYPAQASACEREIKEFLASNQDAVLARQPWLGGIVPHAGWFYSGEIACRVINLLKDVDPIDVVVVFGMHLHAGSANYLMPSGAWQTPFGPVAVADELAEVLRKDFDFQLETSRRFSQDNTIELQMPFIKYLLDPAQVLAVGVPPAAQSLEIGRAVACWADTHNKNIRIVGSTDLTHYGRNYGFSPKGSGQTGLAWVRTENDRRMMEAMLDMAPEKIIDEGLDRQNACCPGAVATAVAALKQMGAKQARSVTYATSYDKSPGDSFVGYAGIVFGK
jgi:AmmeMemoRadiSam system protein B